MPGDMKARVGEAWGHVTALTIQGLQAGGHTWHILVVGQQEEPVGGVGVEADHLAGHLGRAQRVAYEP